MYLSHAFLNQKCLVFDVKTVVFIGFANLHSE